MKLHFSMESVGIRTLKTHLSGYLRRVEQGERLLVTDHGRIVAELGPPTQTALDASVEARYQKLVREGVIRPPVASGNHDWMSLPSADAPPGTAQELLDLDRGD